MQGLERDRNVEASCNDVLSVVLAAYVPVVRVKYRHLILTCFDNMWMTMAHVTDVVDAIQELVVNLVVHVLA